MKNTSTDTATRDAQLAIVNAVQHESPGAILATLADLRRLKTAEGKTGWLTGLNKLNAFLADGRPRFSVFVEGNEKLPFLAFSSLALATCPGAGACAKFCYSLRAWRYPSAFFRQVQNTIMLQTAEGRENIAADLDRQLARKKYSGRRVDLRLYVDGDFASVTDVHYWMGILRDRPRVAGYGYSKSWRELMQFDTWTRESDRLSWPANYVLNISSGSRHGDTLKAAVMALPITRGEFIAVELGRQVRVSEYKTPEYRAEIRAAYGKKAFPCPGRCGECTGAGHACGLPSVGVPVIIGIH